MSTQQRAASIRTLTLVLAAMFAASAMSVRSADAAPLPKLNAAKIKLPKIKPPKIDIKKLKPKVRFVPRAKMSRGTVRLSLTAELTIAGKTKRLSIFDMAVKKTKNTMQVNRKVGKLYVSLRISWEGSRTLAISGAARYLKFKLPVPRLRVKV